MSIALQELIIYAVFTLFYLGAAINCAVVTADLGHAVETVKAYRHMDPVFKAAYDAVYSEYVLAIVATVTALQYTSATLLLHPQ